MRYTHDDLVAFIREEACMSSKKSITDDMDVVHSLGQHGDDADEFMEKYFDTFKVDRGDYDFRRYFFSWRVKVSSHTSFRNSFCEGPIR